MLFDTKTQQFCPDLQNVEYSHPLCPRGRYTGQVVFKRQGQDAVPNGNGTMRCIKDVANDNSQNSICNNQNINCIKIQDINGFDTHTGEWVNGLRQGLGVTNLADGGIYTGAYFNDKRHGLGISTNYSFIASQIHMTRQVIK